MHEAVIMSVAYIAVAVVALLMTLPGTGFPAALHTHVYTALYRAVYRLYSGATVLVLQRPVQRVYTVLQHRCTAVLH